MSDQELPPGVQKILRALEAENEKLKRWNFQLERSLSDQRTTIKNLERQLRDVRAAKSYQTVMLQVNAH